MGNFDIASISGAYNSANAANAATSTSRSSALDYDAFLTLFTTQLQHQDPTNPLESYELAAQLAQFSTVEQLTAMGKNLKQMESYLLSMNNNLMVQMLGKEITGASNVVQLKDGEASKSSYQLDGDAQQVNVKIYDDQGGLVRTLAVGSQSSGSHEIEWDGCDDSGDALGDGFYQFEIEALDSEGNSVDSLTTITGKCSSVHMENGLVYLILDNEDGVAITPSSVTDVRESSII